MMTKSNNMELPFYLQKAVEVGILRESEGKIVGVQADYAEKAMEVARIVDKLQPTSVQDREDTTSQEAIILSRVLSSPPGLARELWGELRTGFGMGNGQLIPLTLWSDDRFKAIAKEIDLTFIGDRSGKFISRESLIAGYSNLNSSSKSVPIITFNQTITELADQELLQSYGDTKFEWETALDVLKQIRVRSLYLETLHNAKQNIKADTKLEEALEYLQHRAMEGVGMMRGSIGNQGQAIQLSEAIIGDPGGQRQNWIDRLASTNKRRRPASTGIPAFDLDIGGGVNFPEPHRLFGGRLMTIAARTKVGKTAIGCQIATSLCSAGMTVGFISAELDYNQIEPRLMASLSRKLLAKHGYHWTGSSDKLGYITVSELENPPEENKQFLMDLVGNLAFKLQETGGKLLLEAPWGACVDTVVNSMRSMKAKNPELRCVILDHFHALAKHKNSPRDTSAALEDRTYRLITAAKELDIDLFVFAQMNQVGLKLEQNNVKSTPKEPELDQIRGTDALSHVSHAVWLIRKNKAVEGEPSDRKLEVWHSAVRSGQHFWEGRKPDEQLTTVRGEVAMSLIQLDYQTQSLKNDDTMQNIDVVNSSRFRK
jgi:hypothetical protein